MQILQLKLDQRKRRVRSGRDLASLELTYHGHERKGGRLDASRDTAHRWLERCIEWLFAYLWARFAKLHARVWFTETKEDVFGVITEARPVDDLLGQIHLAERQLAEIWCERADTLIIGERLYMKLEYEVARKLEGSAFSYYGMTRITFRGVTRVLRMKVVVVPYLEGWALLPKLDD